MPWYRNWGGFWKRALEILAVLGLGVYCTLTFMQWRDFRHNFETDERGWISPSFTFNSEKVFLEGDAFVPGKMFDGYAVIKILNSGKTPIFRTESHVWVEILDHDSPPTFTWQGSMHTITYGGLIFPGKSVDIESHRFRLSGEIFNPTDAEIEALRSDTDYVVAYGYTVYSDSFGMHWTREDYILDAR